MRDIQQLIREDSNQRYQNVYPKTFIDAIVDKQSGKTLIDILNSFNMYFLSYDGNTQHTRLQVPQSLRKQGLWITYVKYNNVIVTEWYNGTKIDDNSWKQDSNWIKGSNMFQGEIMISSEGTWIINGKDTKLPARGPKGEDAKTDDHFSNTSLNAVQNKLINQRFIEIENTVFPIDIEFNSNTTLLEYTGIDQNITISFKIKRRGQLITPQSLTITKDDTNIYNQALSQGSTTTNINKRGAILFKLDCSVQGLNRGKSFNVTMVLPMYFGFSDQTDLTDVTSLTKQAIKTSPNGSYTMNNDTTGKYLWLCVPDNMSINNVTSAGFKFPIEAPITKSTPLGNYKCYRSSSQINKGNVNFIIG